MFDSRSMHITFLLDYEAKSEILNLVRRELLCADVAEWLRRLTRNQFPSGSVGSNPTICVDLVFQVQQYQYVCNFIFFSFKILTLHDAMSR
jgi:hypothetical protein